MTPKKKPLSARAKLVAALTKEILGNNEAAPYLITSEYALCREHKISRVTVRLALSDLERQGLIFKEHGRGTFAYGRKSLPLFNITASFKATSTLEKTIKARNVTDALAQIQAEAPNFDWENVVKVTIEVKMDK